MPNVWSDLPNAAVARYWLIALGVAPAAGLAAGWYTDQGLRSLATADGGPAWAPRFEDLAPVVGLAVMAGTAFLLTFAAVHHYRFPPEARVGAALVTVAALPVAAVIVLFLSLVDVLRFLAAVFAAGGILYALSWGGRMPREGEGAGGDAGAQERPPP